MAEFRPHPCSILGVGETLFENLGGWDSECEGGNNFMFRFEKNVETGWRGNSEKCGLGIAVFICGSGGHRFPVPEF